jgi:uncharacterized integral membrane protein (TIGR00697 family)
MTHNRPQLVPKLKYYDLLMAAFVTVLLCSNLIAPAKVGYVNLPDWFGFGEGFSFGSGNLFFPLGYIFGDILTEVYGYARARKVIWAGFCAIIFASIMAWIIVHLPVSPDEPFNAVVQPAAEAIFGNTWRIVLGSIVAFWVGDFANSYVMARMKLWTQGKWLWSRTIGSTLVGQGLDSLIFYPIAFGGLWTFNTILAVIVFNWIFKVSVEVLMTPVTYIVVDAIKKAEGVDHYDNGTDFTPFSLEIQ